MARELVEKLYKKEVVALSKLDSYDDNNFRIETPEGQVFTLKVRFHGRNAFLGRSLVALGCTFDFSIPSPIPSSFRSPFRHHHSYYTVFATCTIR